MIPPRVRYFNLLYQIANRCIGFSSSRTLTIGVGEPYDPLYEDVPKPCRSKSERKPYPTPMKVLIRSAKEERKARKAQPCRLLEHPPDNGLLVPELVEVARKVYRARVLLLSGISKLLHAIPIQRCRYCFEVHIGYMGHEIRTCTSPGSGLRSATHMWRKGGVQDVIFFPRCFHLSDRVGRPRVIHNEKHSVQKIPAIVELCIQAGLDLTKYPTKRRTKPVYSIEGRIVDFETVSPSPETSSHLNSDLSIPVLEINSGVENVPVGVNFKFDNYTNSDVQLSSGDDGNSLKDIGSATLDSWFEMISGAKRIMEKYRVWTCGYCPEVQVGPKGHKVRKCRASKHQFRDGLHAWQEATIDDVVGPKYVWHVPNLQGPPLVNNLKRYYGKAPAVVELCVQGGAPVPDQCRSMMRLDVVPPKQDEVDLVT